MRGCLKVSSCLLFLLLAGWILAAPAVAQEPPVRVVIDVRTTHSDGKHGMDELVSWAAKRGIQALAFTEHDRQGIRFGLEPIPNILGYTYERPSLYSTGLAEFFDDLHRARKKFPHMALMAGTESMPSYYWTGIPFQDLTLHEADRHLITLGVESPEQVEALPSFDLRHVRQHPWISLAVWGGLALLSLLLIFVLRRKLVPVLVLLCSCTALYFSVIDKEEIDPDEDFIQQAREQGLFAVWTHPATRSGYYDGPMGVKLSTPSYSTRVFQDPTADAFTAKYGDNETSTLAGGMWDRYLLAYMNGLHKRPIWAVSAGDFHFQNMAGEALGNYPMDVWAEKKSPEAILKGMRNGHAVAWVMPSDRNIGIKHLTLVDMRGTSLIPGDEKRVTSQLQLYLELVDLTPSQSPAVPFNQNIEVIVDGKVAIRSQLDLSAPLEETLLLAPGPHVIRVRSFQMEANPFLVHVLG